MSGDPDSPRAAGVAHQANRLAPVAQPERPTLTRLRDRLGEVGFRYDEVVDALGPAAHAALARNHTVPGIRVLSGRDDPLATLIRLWPLQQPVPAADLDRALPGLAEELATAGLLGRTGDLARARVDLRPYAGDDGVDGWVVSDLTPGMDGRIDRVADDYVLGVSSASITLTQLAARAPVATALDLGTGCGVQSLHLARHADRVVATDINQRALTLAAWTLGLNGLDHPEGTHHAPVELVHGNLFQPVADRRFDQVISNPPYVMAPPGSAHLTYREQGLPGDQLVQQVVSGSARLLNPGGTAQISANWAHPAGEEWADRLAGRLAGTGCDLHVVQREVLDPSEYVELWLADAGLVGSPDFRSGHHDWLDHLADLGIEAIGMGWIFLHRGESDDPEVIIEHWPHPVAQPVGPEVAVWSARSRTARLSDADLRARHLATAPDVVTESTARPGEADPQRIVLVQTVGLCRRIPLDTATAGIVGACDGELALGVIIDAVAQLLERDPAALSAEVLPTIRQLVRDGLLTGVR